MFKGHEDSHYLGICSVPTPWKQRETHMLFVVFFKFLTKTLWTKQTRTIGTTLPIKTKKKHKKKKKRCMEYDISMPSLLLHSYNSLDYKTRKCVAFCQREILPSSESNLRSNILKLEWIVIFGPPIVLNEIRLEKMSGKLTTRKNIFLWTRIL